MFLISYYILDVMVPSDGHPPFNFSTVTLLPGILLANFLLESPFINELTIYFIFSFFFYFLLGASIGFFVGKIRNRSIIQ